MKMEITKLNLNLRDGTLSVEGDEKFVRAIYDDFQQRISANLSSPAEEQSGRTPRKPRQQRSAKEGRGKPSCGSRIRALVTEGFFATQRDVAAVVQKLEEKATPYPNNHVAAALG